MSCSSGSAWFLPVGLVVVGVLILATYAVSALHGSQGLTTEIASLLVFVIGALVYGGHLELGAAWAVTAVVLATLANTAVKATIAFVLGSRDLQVRRLHLWGTPRGGSRGRVRVHPLVVTGIGSRIWKKEHEHEDPNADQEAAFRGIE